MKSLLLMSAIVFAAPALAQTAATPAMTSPPASTNAAQPAATAAPATTATPAQAAAPATTATPAEPAANATDAVATVVAKDWGTYDSDNNGNLSKAEFAKWMVALREQNTTAQKTEVKDVNAWSNAAFAQADKDKSGSVSKPELEVFLKG